MQALLKNAKTIPCSLGVRRLATQSTPSTPTIARSPIVWTYLPQQLPYHLGLLLQETLVANRLSAKVLLASPLDAFSPSKIASLRRTADTDILLLLQHTPVYTAGRREKDPEVARLERERLGALGADYVSTMRGGQTTYHGPGQLVGYSIFDMGAANLSTRCYVDYMETFLASLTTSLGVKVYPLEHTGVFTSPTSKIGSIGIHIRRRITLHGFSINIEEQTLDWFRNIVACGLDDVSATSVQTELKKITKSEGREIKVADVVERAVKGFGEGYRREIIMLDGQEENRELQEVIDDGIAGRLPPLAE